MKTVELSMFDIELDDQIQPRVKQKEEVINEYAENLANGAEFPPVDIFYDGKTYWLADGFHRYQAYSLESRDTIPAIIYEGGWRKAIIHASGAKPKIGEAEDPKTADENETPKAEMNPEENKEEVPADDSEKERSENSTDTAADSEHKNKESSDQEEDGQDVNGESADTEDEAPPIDDETVESEKESPSSSSAESGNSSNEDETEGSEPDNTFCHRSPSPDNEPSVLPGIEDVTPVIQTAAESLTAIFDQSPVNYDQAIETIDEQIRQLATARQILVDLRDGSTKIEQVKED